MEPLVKIETVWSEEAATGELCKGCNEPIYSGVNILSVMVNGKVVDSTTRVCNSCYYVIKDGI